MSENERSDTERTRGNDGYTVQCEDCGDVEFDVLEENWFGNERVALYYAGYHDGTEHPDSAVQLSSPKPL